MKLDAISGRRRTSERSECRSGAGMMLWEDWLKIRGFDCFMGYTRIVNEQSAVLIQVANRAIRILNDHKTIWVIYCVAFSMVAYMTMIEQGQRQQVCQ